MRTFVRFATGKSIGSAIIRAATWDWCSHVSFALDFDPQFGEHVLLDATSHHGVALRPVSTDRFRKAQYYQFLGDQKVVAKAVEWTRTQLGRPYDWSGILGIALRERNWHEDDSWFCSELVAEAFIQAGVPLLDDDECFRITPRDVRISPLLRRIG
jgi:uncharacterized protein YycO